MRTCNECGVEKPETEFYLRKRRDGVQYRRGYCKQCQQARQRAKRAADPEAFRAYQRAYYANNLWRQRDSSLRRKYGITYADFQAMLEAQETACAICRETFPEPMKAHVDHDHKTGKVRALLCRHCNTGIGNLRDNPDLLMAAAAYLLQHQEVSVDAPSV